METTNNSKSGVSGILVLSGTPSGFNIGNGYKANLIPSSQFRWSSPLQVTAVEWNSDQRGGWFRLTMSDGSTPVCLFDRLPSDEDRRLVASAVRAIDPMVNESPVTVQLAVAGRSSHSQYFCGLRLPQMPQPLGSNHCPW